MPEPAAEAVPAAFAADERAVPTSPLAAEPDPLAASVALGV